MFPDITIKGLMGCCGGTTRVILDNVRVAAKNVVGKDTDCKIVWGGFYSGYQLFI